MVCASWLWWLRGIDGAAVGGWVLSLVYGVPVVVVLVLICDVVAQVGVGVYVAVVVCVICCAAVFVVLVGPAV